MTEAEILERVDPESRPIVERWLERGDGVALYVNQAMDHSQHGHEVFLSYGSERAQIEESEPPERMPDFPSMLGWPYRLEAKVRR